MRLKCVTESHRFKERLRLGLIRLMSRSEPVDVIKTILYRPELWGRPFGQWLQRVMRGPSPWTVTERELFAAFTSKLNQCVF